MSRCPRDGPCVIQCGRMGMPGRGNGVRRRGPPNRDSDSRTQQRTEEETVGVESRR